MNYLFYICSVYRRNLNIKYVVRLVGLIIICYIFNVINPGYVQSDSTVINTDIKLDGTIGNGGQSTYSSITATKVINFGSEKLNGEYIDVDKYDGYIKINEELDEYEVYKDVYEIKEEHGDRMGGNLFHSFEKFDLGGYKILDLPNTKYELVDTARFTANKATDNIICRVTGGDPSNIDGVIDLSGENVKNANFFFINPNGVMFQEHAELNVGGSFYTSTADYIKFEDGKEFVARGGRLTTLTTASPEAFGFIGDKTPGTIDFKGGEKFLNLMLPEGKTFAVVGGDVTLDHSSLWGRHILIGSTKSAGEVTFKNDDLDIGLTSGGGVITLKNHSRFDTGSENNANVEINSKILKLEGGESGWGSEIFLENTNDLGKGIEIKVDDLELRDNSFITTSPYGALMKAAPIYIRASNIILDGQIGAKANANDNIDNSTGDITIENDDRLSIIGLNGGGLIVNDQLENGFPGDIKINSKKSYVEIDNVNISCNTTDVPGGTISISSGTSVNINSSTFSAAAYGNGSAGSVLISADNSLTLNSASISVVGAYPSGVIGGGGLIRLISPTIKSQNTSMISSSLGWGDSGNIAISAYGLSLIECDINATTLAEGDGGNVALSVNSLDIKNTIIQSSELGAQTLYFGEIPFTYPGGGDAGHVEIQGSTMSLTNSRIETTAASGAGGTIDIDANSMILTDSEISSSVTGGEKNAGKVDITSSTLEMKGETSEISSETQAAGNAGSVTLNVGEFYLNDGTISSKSTENATGNPGTVSIQGQTGSGSFADKIIINKGKVLTTIESNQGGDDTLLANITISAKELELRSGTISSSTAGIGSAGSITLLADKLDAENSKITSRSTGQGAAGSIFVGADSAPLHDLELSGSEISVHAIDGPQPGEEREGNIHIWADGFAGIDGSTITASVDNGLGGDVSIQQPQLLIVKDQSEILAQTSNYKGGRIEIAADLFVQSADSLINADAGVGTDGEVRIDAPKIGLESGLAALSTELLDASAVLRQGCAAKAVSDVNSFTVSRRNGLPLSPEGLIQTFDLASAGWLEKPQGSQNDSMVMAQNEMAEGAVAFRGGNLAAAGENYSRASMLYEKIGDSKARSDALQDLGQTQMITGKHDEAIKTLRGALVLAEQSGDSAQIAAALNKLGNAHLAMGNIKTAETLLSEGVSRAIAAGRGDLEIISQNNLGNLYMSKSLFEEALDNYLKSARLAKKTDDLILEIKSLSNASRAALEAGAFDRSTQYAKQAFELTKGVSDSYQKASLLIHIGNSFNKLAKLTANQRDNNLLDAYAALTVAASLARADRDNRLNSYALGNLGDLYRTENRYEEALFLVREALQLAETAAVPELICRWHWLEGQLLWDQGYTGPAIDAYYRAVGVLEETRQDAMSQYGSSEVYFRNSVAPIYFDLIDALFQASDRVDDTETAKTLWKEARNIMEMMKGAELCNYFKDECLAEIEAKAEPLENVVKQHKGTIGVYPLVLEDRMELLVMTPTELKRYSMPGLGRAKVRTTVEHFYKVLFQDGNEYLKPCQDLYDWLVRPYVNDLDASVTTIVFMPSGILRTVPIAALHDGQQYLIEKFALAIAPTLKLTEPKPLNKTDPTPLLAGISETISFPVGVVPPREVFPALAKVPAELQGIQDIFGGEKLLNADFVRDSIKASLSDIKPSIVHIASHAHFSHDLNESFILAYNEKININDLAKLIGLARFGEDPIELLMLSACETALGDERAALGLAGISIKAGARSAIGSLWPIYDEAAYELVVNFYNNLKEHPDLTKAEALRNAQLSFYRKYKKCPKCQRCNKWELLHPRCWASFIVINNWL